MATRLRPTLSGHLKDLPHLQVFTLHYAQRLDVSDRELAQIILSCRKLRSFRLFHDPLTMGDGVSTLTLNLLSMLADGEGRSELADLFVDVDARDPPSPRPIHVQDAMPQYIILWVFHYTSWPNQSGRRLP